MVSYESSTVILYHVVRDLLYTEENSYSEHLVRWTCFLVLFCFFLFFPKPKWTWDMDLCLKTVDSTRAFMGVLLADYISSER